MAGLRVRAYTHGKGASEVIEDDPRAGISGVVHRELCGTEERAVSGPGTDVQMAKEDGAVVVLCVSDALNFSSNPCTCQSAPHT